MKGFVEAGVNQILQRSSEPQESTTAVTAEKKQHVYLYIRDPSTKKWSFAGGYTSDGIEIVLDEARTTLGDENVFISESPDAEKSLNRQLMIQQMGKVGSRIAKQFTTFKSRPTIKRPMMRVSPQRPMGRTMVERLEQEHQKMFTPPSPLSKTEGMPPVERTRYGRPLKPINPFRDDKYPVSYLIQRRKQAMQRMRRYHD